MAASDAVSGTAVARAEVRKSLDRLEYHLSRGAKGAKGVRREKAYLDALHRQTVRMGGVATGLNYTATPLESFGDKAARGLASSNSKTVGRMKSSVLADFSADGLAPARDWTRFDPNAPWVWTANGSACPSCLAKHGDKRTGPFIPMHPSCLCIPTPLAQAGGIRPLSEGELIDTARQYGDPRYFKKLKDLENGTIDLSTLAKVENVNESAKGYAAVQKHILKSEVQPGGTTLSNSTQRLADPDRYESTADYWRTDGAWDPERERLHDSIVRKFIDDADLGDPPEFQMMGGGPASGKSTMLEAPDSPVLRGRKAVQIDTDEIKKFLPEYDDMVKAGDNRAAAFSHQESSHISKRILAEVDDARSVVLDGVGDKGIDDVIKKTKAARDRGQKVTANYATNDVDDAIKYSFRRAEATGREVPEAYIRKAHADVTDTFFDALEQGIFDEAYLMDTAVFGKPRSIVRFVDGVLDIDDDELLKAFLKKSNRHGPGAQRTVDDIYKMADDFARAKADDVARKGDDLVRLLPDDDDFRMTTTHSRADLVQGSDDWWASMSAEEADAVKQYSRSFYDYENRRLVLKAEGLADDAIEAQLRAEGMHITEHFPSISRNLDDAFDKADDIFGQMDPVLSHRKMRSGGKGTEKFRNDLDNALVSGGEVDHIPYASTTIDEYFALNAPSEADLVLEVVSKSGAYLGQNSAYKEEFEWLIRQGRTFKVEGKKTIKFVRGSESQLKDSLAYGKVDPVAIGKDIPNHTSLARDFVFKGGDPDDITGFSEHIAKYLTDADDFIREEARRKYVWGEREVYQIVEV